MYLTFERLSNVFNDTKLYTYFESSNETYQNTKDSKIYAQFLERNCSLFLTILPCCCPIQMS